MGNELTDASTATSTSISPNALTNGARTPPLVADATITSTIVPISAPAPSLGHPFSRANPPAMVIAPAARNGISGRMALPGDEAASDTDDEQPDDNRDQVAVVQHADDLVHCHSPF